MKIFNYPNHPYWKSGWFLPWNTRNVVCKVVFDTWTPGGCRFFSSSEFKSSARCTNKKRPISISYPPIIVQNDNNLKRTGGDKVKGKNGINSSLHVEYQFVQQSEEEIDLGIDWADTYGRPHNRTRSISKLNL